MTDDELKAIEGRTDELLLTNAERKDIDALIAEVRRLREELTKKAYWMQRAEGYRAVLRRIMLADTEHPARLRQWAREACNIFVADGPTRNL